MCSDVLTVAFISFWRCFSLWQSVYGASLTAACAAPGGQYQYCNLLLACTADTHLQGSDTGNSVGRTSQLLLYHCLFLKGSGSVFISGPDPGELEQLQESESCFWLEHIKGQVWELSTLLLGGNNSLLLPCQRCSSLEKLLVAAAAVDQNKLTFSVGSFQKLSFSPDLFYVYLWKMFCNFVLRQ